MKCLVFLSILFPIFCYGQVFAPDDAVWHFKRDNNDIVDFTVTGDTLIQGRLCKVIDKTYHNCMLEQEYLSVEDSVVYRYWDNHFDTLYNFGARTGDSWWNGFTFYKVDSSSYINVNNIDLKILYIKDSLPSTGQYENSYIIERIGTPTGFTFDVHLLCDPLDISILKCYEDPQIGAYVLDGQDCDLDVAVEFIDRAPMNYIVYPNPAKNSIYLEMADQAINENTNFILQNSNGTKIISFPLLCCGTSNFEFSVERVPTGLYFYTLRNDKGNIQTGKIVIQNR